MAKAERIAVIEPIEIVLSLTKNEAETLRAILENVGGSSERSRRKYSDAVNQALANIGIDGAARDLRRDIKSIYFQ